MIKAKLYHFSENAASLFLIKVIELALTIWLIPFLIFKVGLNNYGKYAFALAVILFFVNVLNYGFNLATVRDLVKHKHDSKRINQLFNEVISVKLVLTISIYLLLTILIVMIPSLWQEKEILFFSSFLLMSEYFSLRWFFLGMEQMKYKVLINVCHTLLYTILIVMFVNETTDYIYIAFYQAIGMLVVGIISFIVVVRKYQFKLKLFPVKKSLVYLKTNFSSFINLVVPSTFGNTIILLVGFLGLPIQVTFIQIGVKVTGAFSTVNSVLTKVFYPLVNREDKTTDIAKLVLLILGVFFSSVMFIGSEILVEKWLHLNNDTFIKEFVSTLKILSPIPFFMAVISSYGINGLLVHYKDNLFSKITMVSLVVAVSLSFVLIPSFEFYGGAYALLIGRLIFAWLSYIYYKKVINE